MQKLRYSSSRFSDPQTPREFLINCSFEIEDDGSAFWGDRVKGFILLDHALEYLKDSEEYERKIKALAGLPTLSESARAIARGGRR